MVKRPWCNKVEAVDLIVPTARKQKEMNTVLSSLFPLYPAGVPVQEIALPTFRMSLPTASNLTYKTPSGAHPVICLLGSTKITTLAITET